MKDVLEFKLAMGDCRDDPHQWRNDSAVSAPGDAIIMNPKIGAWERSQRGENYAEPLQRRALTLLSIECIKITGGTPLNGDGTRCWMVVTILLQYYNI